MIEKITLSEFLANLESATDFSSVFANSSSGTPIRVSKSDLVRDLMGCYIGTVTSQDWNDLTSPGIYFVTGATGDNKPTISSYGILIILKADVFISQTFIADYNAGIAYRMNLRGSWRSWNNI